jgi:hypothetical protein
MAGTYGQGEPGQVESYRDNETLTFGKFKEGNDMIQLTF